MFLDVQKILRSENINNILLNLTDGLILLLVSLTSLIVLDFLMGVMSAFINEEISSKTCFFGICKKIMLFSLVIASILIDNLLNSTPPIASIVVWFFIANETMSIVENASKMGIQAPKFLVDILEKIKSSSNKGDDDYK